MLRSMTGYAASSGRRGKMGVFITVKSVNHRFLDLHLRLPPELEAMEPKVRRAVRDRLQRGHIDLTAVLEREGGVEAHIDRALVSAYLDAYNKLRVEFGITTEPDLNTILKVPGALNFVPATLGSDDARETEELVLNTLAEALDRLDTMRAEEARTTVEEMTGRLTQIRAATDEVEQLRTSAERVYLERIRDRVKELVGDAVAPERLAQEAAMLADRSDVSEELLRMKSHLQQFQTTLTSPDGTGGGAEVGKRLDFLLQEMNRESNTILSKTSGLGDAGIRITNLGLQVKAEIEKLREQVQNLL